MNSSLRSIFFISIISFVLLELGFYLEGFLQFILFSIVTIISFVMLFFFYGYVKESKKKKSNNILVFAALMVLPLLSIAFNPTYYFRAIPENKIVMLAWKHPEQVLKNESSRSLTFLRDGTFRLKEFGFWMNTVSSGSYTFKGRLIKLDMDGEKQTLKLKRYYDVKKLYVMHGRNIDYKDNYLVESMDTLYIDSLIKNPVIMQ